jgi:hypothetical protein
MQQQATQNKESNSAIYSRRFGYLHWGYGPASLAAGLIVAGILGLMLSLN